MIRSWALSLERAIGLPLFEATKTGFRTAAVSTAISLWGDEMQQATYLPAFTGSSVPAAALALLEPRPLFDPFVLQTRWAGGRLNGVKSLVPLGASAELFVIAADVEDQGPALFLVESDHPGVIIEAEPAMGLRAASLSRVILEEVPAVQLGTFEDYAECAAALPAWVVCIVPWYGGGRARLRHAVRELDDRFR